MCATIQWGSAALLAVIFCGSARGQVEWTSRVSVDSAGMQGNNDSGGGYPQLGPVITPDGRFVAFESRASNLVPGDTNGVLDIFVHDRQTGVTSRVSLDSQGAQADLHSYAPALSADGRYVAFSSLATNLVPGDSNGTLDIFVHDRQTGQTIRVSVDSSGAEGNGDSILPSISADGRTVAFSSGATNLVPGDTNGFTDVFVHDIQTGQTVRVSVDSAGAQANNASAFPDAAAISADGRSVAFQSFADNLVPGDTNAQADVFVHDLVTGQTSRVSVDSAGNQGDLGSGRHGISITPDGRSVVFMSYATNLVPGDTNGFGDIFVHDLQSGQTSRVNVSTSGAQANADTDTVGTSISSDGRFVAFDSIASNLVSGDNAGSYDVFVHDRQSGETARVSVDAQGGPSNSHSTNPSISGDGRFVTFISTASNLVAGDTNSFSDVFVSDRAPTSFTSLCDPGVSGVIPCPCSNPPAGADRGCDNSSATGGASLSASGIAYLSNDTLEMTTSGERPTATSIFVQASAPISTGVPYGQGVRCAGGVVRRLFVKTAIGGSITVPDVGANDPSISARSAALGVPIQGGESRYYFVYYRDPAVLGGCPASSTFNATQTGSVVWSW